MVMIAIIVSIIVIIIIIIAIISSPRQYKLSSSIMFPIQLHAIGIIMMSMIKYDNGYGKCKYDNDYDEHYKDAIQG